MNNNFRENLRNELNYQGITVKELSAKTGIPIASLDCYLGSRSTVPSAENALKIAQFLKVSVEYLVIGENKNTIKLPGKPSREAQEIIRWIGSLNQEQCKLLLKLIQTFKVK
ncbi:MAG: helix-turn-helix domain-containing protein [Treponema sp.]|jgi:transcriptional regulator with XRE-family HTH domain|nr:helix-turn-helix domain-containing protein [Treponema sp.]